MSIDERRSFYRNHPFGAARSEGQDVKEVWFAGVHSDIGGSYPESESQLSRIALKWILDEAEREGLLIDQSLKASILGGKPPYVTPDPLTTNQHESLRGLWLVAELFPQIAKRRTSKGSWINYIRFGLARRRYIPPDAVVHESVDQRLNSKLVRYDPPNLPRPYHVLR
jgi:Uncharacterized alpha/beta hydrolase domain (DUF2235)